MNKDTNKEKCLKIPGFSGYYASPVGDIYSSKHKTPGKRNNYVMGDLVRIRPSNRGGYLSVTLWNNGEGASKRVHRLIALTFIKPNGKKLVLHKDGNSLNNTVDNLYWGTYSDNMADALRHGTFVSGFRLNLNRARGEKTFRSKFIPGQILDIRRKRAEGMMFTEIAKEYGCSAPAIEQIVKRKVWKHI